MCYWFLSLGSILIGIALGGNAKIMCLLLTEGYLRNVENAIPHYPSLKSTLDPDVIILFVITNLVVLNEFISWFLMSF